MLQLSRFRTNNFLEILILLFMDWKIKRTEMAFE